MTTNNTITDPNSPSFQRLAFCVGLDELEQMAKAEPFDLKGYVGAEEALLNASPLCRRWRNEVEELNQRLLPNEIAGAQAAGYTGDALLSKIFWWYLSQYLLGNFKPTSPKGPLLRLATLDGVEVKAAPKINLVPS